MSALLQSALEGGVLRLTLSDAATRNSLSEAMMAALTTTLDNAAADKAVRIRKEARSDQLETRRESEESDAAAAGAPLT